MNTRCGLIRGPRAASLKNPCPSYGLPISKPSMIVNARQRIRHAALGSYPQRSGAVGLRMNWARAAMTALVFSAGRKRSCSETGPLSPRCSRAKHYRTTRIIGSSSTLVASITTSRKQTIRRLEKTAWFCAPLWIISITAIME